MEGVGRLRWRARLDDYLVPLIVVALLVAAIGVGVVYFTYVDPGTDTEEVTVASWQTTPSFSHQAEVQRSNLVFPSDAVLRDRSLYFTQISPVLDATFSYGVSGEPGEVDTSIESTLIIRSVSDEGGEYWRVEEPLSSEDAAVETGDTLSTSYQLNISDILVQIESIQSDLGSSVGSTEVFVQNTASTTGTVADTSFSHDETYTMTVDPGENTYSIETDAESESFSESETVVEERTYGPLRTVGGPLLILLGLTVAIGLAVARYRDMLEVTEHEREVLRYHAQRKEFDEWITTGSVPEAARPSTAVRVDDLEGLVDVAIDSEARVIEDRDSRTYLVVLDDDRVFTFQPPVDAEFPE
ncbi:MAG: DUF5305 domain-containing protein [Halobacteriales archaeon]